MNRRPWLRILVCRQCQLPTFIFMKEGTIVDEVVGARKDELQQKILLDTQKEKHESMFNCTILSLELFLNLEFYKRILKISLG